LTSAALNTPPTSAQAGVGLSLLRHLDLVVLAIALPIFVVAGFPLLGYAAVALAWLLQRGIQAYAERRAVASGDRKAAIGVLAGTMMARLWLLGLSVLGAGLVDRDAGLAAAVLAFALFTIAFSTLLIVKPLEDARR
jgi:hypothetical protein